MCFSFFDSIRKSPSRLLCDLQTQASYGFLHIQLYLARSEARFLFLPRPKDSQPAAVQQIVAQSSL